jgi:hypothetical protein
MLSPAELTRVTAIAKAQQKSASELLRQAAHIPVTKPV